MRRVFDVCRWLIALLLFVIGVLDGVVRDEYAEGTFSMMIGLVILVFLLDDRRAP